MRVRGWTYRAIAKLLAESCGLGVSPSTKPLNIEEDERSAGGVTATEADIQARIAALKSRVLQKEASENNFQFDPDESLRLNKAAQTDVPSSPGRNPVFLRDGWETAAGRDGVTVGLGRRGKSL